MTTIWQDAAAFLSENLAVVSNESVTLARGSDTSTLSGTFGRGTFMIVDAAGSAIEMIGDDFLCDTADYKINDMPVKPARGDKLSRTLPNGDVVILEVHQPSPNAKPYTLSCQDLRMRVHLKRVGG